MHIITLKRTDKMKKHLLFLSALMILACSANAQLNLNRLGKKVKEQVESKKEEVETDVEQLTESNHLQQEAEQRAIYDYKKSYKPSAAALAANPMAADQTVEPMYTKSISEIHAAYEQFDSELFPYQPYYNYKQFYYLNDEEDEEIRTGQYTEIVMNIAKLPAGAFYYMPYTPIQTPDGEVVVTQDEFF